MELYKKYRPKKFSKLLGQESIPAMLHEMIEDNSLPHSLLLVGPSGTGKTTTARILRKLLKCGSNDYREVNASETRGIDLIRDIQNRVPRQPMFGDVKIWTIDECQKLTSDAQNAFLKLLEDTPDHVYFFLCTTHPGKLLKTIKTRCTQVNFRNLDPLSINELVSEVAFKEKIKLKEEVLECIIEHAEGSARKSLVLLEQVSKVKKPKEQLEILKSEQTEISAIEICRYLMGYKKVTWKGMAEILRRIDKTDVEGIRRLVLAYANKILISGKCSDKALATIQAFRDNWYDCGESGLIVSCYEVVLGSS